MRQVLCEGWNASEQSGTRSLTNDVFENFFLFLFMQIRFLPFETEQKAFKYIKNPNDLITLT